LKTNGSVVVACCVAQECIGPSGGIEAADRVAKKRIDADPCIIPVVLLPSDPVPRQVLVCAAASPARPSEKISAAIVTDKNKAASEE
jgi:hypothetical protein